MVKAVGFMAALVLLFVCVVNGATDYAVGGIVVDSRTRQPVANALVSLAPATARDQKIEQVTKRDGRFEFSVGNAGKYSLQVTKPGYPTQAYKQANFAGVSSAIVVRDDQDTTHIVFEAIRGSVLHGQIKDEDSEPVGNALVAVFQSLVVNGETKVIPRGQVRADAAGEYRIPNLPRGNYYVCAMGRPWFADSLIWHRPTSPSGIHVGGLAPPLDPERAKQVYSPDPGFRGTAFATTCYPQTQKTDEASLVRVEAGGQATVSITLPFARAVSVKGAISVPGEMSEGRAVLCKLIYDHCMSFLEEWVRKDAFEFHNVPLGSYEVVATSQAGSGPSSWSIHQEVEVGSSDMEVTLRPPQMASLTGRILFEGEAPASMDNLFVSLRNEKGIVNRTDIRPDGAFSLNRIAPGKYEITAGSKDYIAAFFTGPAGERLPLSFELASGETVKRDLTLTRAMSVIEGTVQRAAIPQVGAFVLLMPKDASQRWAYRVDQTDSDGSFTLSAIPSGDYYLIALSKGDDVAYRDAKVVAVLMRAAKSMHVKPGEHLNLSVDVVDQPQSLP